MDSLVRPSRLLAKERSRRHQCGGNHKPGAGRSHGQGGHPMNTHPVLKNVQVVLAFVLVWAGIAINAQAVSSPSAVTVKILEMRVSRNTDCSGAVSIFTAASPTPMNLAGS